MRLGRVATQADPERRQPAFAAGPRNHIDELGILASSKSLVSWKAGQLTGFFYAPEHCPAVFILCPTP